MARCVEILLIEILRNQRYQDGPAKGMLAGLANQTIAAALRAMHADLAHNWSVAELADSAGVSRSVFAERFSGSVRSSVWDRWHIWQVGGSPLQNVP